MRLSTYAFCLLLLAFATAESSIAQISWNLDFQDVANSTGVGFDDPLFGETRRQTLFAATEYINSVLDENGSVDIEIAESLTSGTGFLAQATPFFFFDPNNRFDNGQAFHHITTGTDNASFIDGRAVFNFGYNFNSDLSPPTANQYDLYSLAAHEFAHILGFGSLVLGDGTSDLPNTNGTPSVFTQFDSFLVNGAGEEIFLNATPANPVDLLGSVFFSGDNAVEANGGNLVRMYAPVPFEPGVSIGHLDPGVHSDAVMHPFFNLGEMRRTFNPVEIGVFKDLGYAISTVGDFDANGVVDCDDLDGYVGNLDAAATAELTPLDLNNDGIITLDDANTHITTLVETSNGVVGTFPGDLNCDGEVNVLGDAFALIGNLGNSVTSYAQGDINFDGTVNVLGDAFILVGNLGLTNDLD